MSFDVGIPRNTRLYLVTRHDDCTDLWIAIADTSARMNDRVGTFLRFYDNGIVERITVNPDMSEEHFMIKEKKQ